MATLALPPVANSGISVAEGTQAYARLRARVIEAGILERSYLYYTVMIVACFGGFLLSAWGVYALDNYLLLAVACLGFTFFSVQIAGINHDAGHRAVFKSTALNNILGMTTSACVGIVFDNWRTRHNEHHAFPNQTGKDPDLEIPFLSTHESMAAAKSGVQRFLTRFQAYYYYPLGSIVSFSNRLGSVSYFIHRKSLGDIGKFLIYVPAIVVLFVLPFAIFSVEKALFVFFLVHVSSGIYLMNCFAPNHKGMDQIDDATGLSFIELQVRTARDVRGGLLTDNLLVGLNYQVEHHLFPSTPRNKLPRIKPLLLETCRELGLPFVETGIIETNRDILRQLHRVQKVTLARSPASYERQPTPL